MNTEAPFSERTKSVATQLLKKQAISKDQLEIALKEQRDTGSHETLGAILVRMGFITEAALGEVLSESTGVKKIDLRGGATVIDQRLVRKVPKDFALNSKLIPISYAANTITIAIADVFDIIALDQVKRFFPSNFKINPVYAPEADIINAIDQYYEYEMSIDGILREIESGEIEVNEDQKAFQEDYKSPMVRLVDAILTDAVRIGSSDIHFEPEDHFLRLRYRIDGKLEQIRSFHKDYWPAIAVRIKIMAGLNIAERRRPQDGRVNSVILGRNINFRVSVQPTVNGENIVMRILDERKAILSLNKLGFVDRDIELIKTVLKRPEGIIILTGPTGCGKTTTLYTLLNYINSIDKNIMTLEDPVEYHLPLIRQSNINPEAGWDFANSMRHIMRQDPDIILVGEIRDKETAITAVQASMTGHQVYSSLHTNDALSAIPRLMNIGVDPYLISGSIIAIIAQRLARRLCPYCKEEKPITEEEINLLGSIAQNVKTLYHPVGCSKCRNTGYKGRIAITEVLPVNRSMDDLIAKKATKNEMLSYALKNGFSTMQQDGIAKVINGIISLEELVETIDMTDRMLFKKTLST